MGQLITQSTTYDMNDIGDARIIMLDTIRTTYLTDINMCNAFEELCTMMTIRCCSAQKSEYEPRAITYNDR